MRRFFRYWLLFVHLVERSHFVPNLAGILVGFLISNQMFISVMPQIERGVEQGVKQICHSAQLQQKQ